MALIAMAVYSTEENQKDKCLERTLESLKNTVDFAKHRLILSVNGHTERTREIFSWYQEIVSEFIFNNENIGTAEAINKVWRLRQKGEHAIKMDDDVVIHASGWVEIMEEVCKDPWIGQVGLKRPDLIENPNHENPFYRSEMIEIEGMIVEKCHHIMGTCVMHSSNLLGTIGYMWQPALYGFDDSFMSLRSELAGFKNVFIPWVKIDHIDEGATPWQKWKEDHSGAQWDAYHKAHADFSSGVKDIYYNPYDSNNRA
jgi:GT2 family glycosyltransferase